MDYLVNHTNKNMNDIQFFNDQQIIKVALVYLP